MELLLDTHTLIWFTNDDGPLSQTAKNALLDSKNQIFVSPASFWEIAIKTSRGKYVVSTPHEKYISFMLEKYDFTVLGIEPRHTAVITTLPHIYPTHMNFVIYPALVLGVGYIVERSETKQHYTQRLEKNEYREAMLYLPQNVSIFYKTQLRWVYIKTPLIAC